jgi:hypothetical protein
MAKDETEHDDATTDETASKEGSKPAVAKATAAAPDASREDDDETDDDENDDDENDDDENDDDENDDDDDETGDEDDDEAGGSRPAAGEETAAEEDTDREPAPPEAAAADAPSPKKAARAGSTERAALVADADPARASAGRKRAPLPPDPPPAAVGKSVFLFVIVIGALSAGFWFLGKETGGERSAPRWKTGQTVDVNITLVATDRNDLACSSATVVAGRRCEFESKTKAVEPKPEDDKLLKPYTTTDNIRFLAAGLWSQPELDARKLPSDRFTVKCKYSVEGEIKRPAVRWNARSAFGDRTEDWYAGLVKDCKLVP